MTNPENNEENKPADFLEDEKPGEQYIRPHLDMRLSPKHKNECREIVAEIKRFGVNQRQLLFLIDLLALEVENNDLMRKIREVTREHRESQEENAPVGGIIIPT
jgi:hypothetical protein